MFVDEAAFANKELMTHFIIPLLKVKDRKIVCISTPATDNQSVFSQLITEDSEGEFKVTVIEGMCKECASAGSRVCPHRSAVSTPWTNMRSQMKIEKILMRIDPFAAARELRGAQVDTKIPAFPADHVNRVFSEQVRSLCKFGPSVSFLCLTPLQDPKTPHQHE